MSINRELSQLASFIDVQESNNFIGISTGGTYTVGIGTSSVTISSNGTVTAPLFVGATGSSLIDHIDLQDEGNLVGTGFTTLNFVGAAVTITQGVTGVATITVDSAVVGGEDGAVQFASGGTLTGISTLLFADSTNHRVGIGSSSPTAKLDVGGTVNVSGVSTFTGNVSFGSTATFGDDDRLRFGDNNELDIYYSGAKSFIKSGVGQLRIKAASSIHLMYENLDGTQSESYAKFSQNGSSELYYDGSKKFKTVGTGVSISSGTASTATIYGPGNLIIDPAPVDDNGGIVRIKGDLYVDGTTTEINSTTLTIDDLNVVVASGATNGLTADGAGLSVAGAGATIKYNYNGGSEQWVFNKAPYYNTDRLLTTADEGTGNGLDADTLDGQEGTHYLDYSNFVGVATDSSLLSGISYTSFLRSDVADIKTFGDLTFNDNIKLNLGSSGQIDSSIYHSGTDTKFDNRTGDLILETIDTGEGGAGADIVIKAGTGKTSVLANVNGAVELWNNGSKKFETTGYGVTVTGGLNVSGISTFVDQVNISPSSGNGKIKYTGSNVFIIEGGTASTNDIQIDAHQSWTNIYCNAQSSTELHWAYPGQNGKRLETTGYGVSVYGGLNVSGVATATDFNSASDENLKTNIRTIEDPLAKVVQIRGVNFDWKESQRPALGVIAQEVEKVLPELVTDNGTKTVNYNGLIGLLIEAVKAQQEEIDILKSKIK